MLSNLPPGVTDRDIEDEQGTLACRCADKDGDGPATIMVDGVPTCGLCGQTVEDESSRTGR